MGIRSYQNKINKLRAKNEGSYIFACQAAVPLVLTPDLLYQLWNNFKHYQYYPEGGEIYKITHIAVSDLILADFCKEVGYELYEIKKGVRDILLTELDHELGGKRKNTIAKFLEDYALLEYRSNRRRNLKDIHLLTSQSILNPEEMERQIINRINSAQTDTEKINYLLLHHNLLPVGFKSDLGEISSNVNSNSLSPILIEEENPEATGVLTVALPAVLKDKIKTISKTGVNENVRIKDPLKISISNGDLINSSYPIIVGHIVNDGITGAEQKVDAYCNYELSERHRLSLYPGEIGTSQIFLRSKGGFKGAIVVGLGEPYTLNAYHLARTIEQGVLQYLMSLIWEEVKSNIVKTREDEGVSVVLIGTSYSGISIEDSVRATIEGVEKANSKIKDLNQNAIKLIDRIEFVEKYEDKSLECLHILTTIEAQGQMNIQVPEKNIRITSGADRNAFTEDRRNWWRRIRIETISKNTEDKIENSFQFLFNDATSSLHEVSSKLDIIDSLVGKMLSSDTHDQKLAKVLFELLIPNEIRDKIITASNILWVLDSDSAAYPWELLQDSSTNSLPLSCKVGMIRQLAAENYRSIVKTNHKNQALIIGDPDLKGFMSQIPGAVKEAQLVSNLLKDSGYGSVKTCIGNSAKEIITALFKHEYKIMHIAGHGFLSEDPNKSSGILIGNDIFLTSAEISQMSAVPELVFINCSFAGKIDADRETAQLRNKYSVNIGFPLIKNGVKALVISGWSIDDSAAFYFTKIFYEKLLSGANFGESVKEARLRTFNNYPHLNTWGAYQCYGDPFYTLTSQKSKKENEEAENKIQQSHQTPLNRAKLVGELKFKNRYARCILLKGEYLVENIKDELVLVLNTHVLNNNDGQIFAEEAEITFKSLDNENLIYKLDVVIWSSAVNELDTTIAKFKNESLKKLIELTTDIEAYPIAEAFSINEAPDTYIRRYVNGEFNNVEMLDYNDPYFHYKASMQEPGSSGSPLFNEKWELLGIHHSSRHYYEHNDSGKEIEEIGEGIWIGAAIREFRKEFKEKPEKVNNTPDSKVQTPVYKNDIYISYARDEMTSKWVNEIFLPDFTSYLIQEIGETPTMFIDSSDLGVGQDLPTILKENLMLSKILVAIITPGYLRSSYCLSEWMTFKERAQLCKANLILPIVLRKGEYLNNPLINEIQWFDLSSFNFIVKNLHRSKEYVGFSKEMSTLASRIGSLLHAVPAFDIDWPVIDAGKASEIIDQQTKKEQSMPSFIKEQYADNTNKTSDKVIKVFITSTSDDGEDRNAIIHVIEQLNKQFHTSDIYLQVTQWEESMDDLPKADFQSSHNKALKDCDIFVALFYTKVSSYYLEEFERAFAQFEKTDKPLIFTYIKEKLLTTKDIIQRDTTSLDHFKKRLNELGHFPSTYNSRENLILSFSNQLSKVIEQYLATNNIKLAKTTPSNTKKKKNDDFYSEQDIRELVTTKSNLGRADTVKGTLLIFETSKQHTWLVTTERYIYILLDDNKTRDKDRLIQTFFEKAKTQPLEIRDSSKSKGSRVVKFAAEETWWFYSRKLFPTNEKLTKAVQRLINNNLE